MVKNIHTFTTLQQSFSHIFIIFQSLSLYVNILNQKVHSIA